MMESLSKEDLDCEMGYLRLWHAGMCDVVSSLREKLKEANRAAQKDKERAVRDEGKAWQLEEEAKKAKTDYDVQKEELSKLKTNLAKAVEEATTMKANYANSLNECRELGVALEKLKESALKEKDELTAKVQDLEKKLEDTQEKHDDELEHEFAETYENIMAQVRTLYPSLNLEGVHYMHAVINGKVVKHGDEPGGFVEVVVPEPMHTSSTTRLLDTTGQNDSSDARRMEIDPNVEMPPQDNPTGVSNMETEQGGN